MSKKLREDFDKELENEFLDEDAEDIVDEEHYDKNEYDDIYCDGDCESCEYCNDDEEEYFDDEDDFDDTLSTKERCTKVLKDIKKEKFLEIFITIGLLMHSIGITTLAILESVELVRTMFYINIFFSLLVLFIARDSIKTDKRDINKIIDKCEDLDDDDSIKMSEALNKHEKVVNVISIICFITIIGSVIISFIH